MRRRSGMTERGWNEEFSTRTGMNDFPSSLSEPTFKKDSEEEAARDDDRKGRGPRSQLLPPSKATTSWIGAETFCLSRQLWHCEHPVVYPASLGETRIRRQQPFPSTGYGCVNLNCSHL